MTNLLTFNHPQEEQTLHFTDQEQANLIQIYKSLVPDEIKEHFPNLGTESQELKNECNNNNGSLHICSGSGYVNMLKNKTIEYTLPIRFPGSIINIIMRKI